MISFSGLKFVYISMEFCFIINAFCSRTLLFGAIYFVAFNS